MSKSEDAIAHFIESVNQNIKNIIFLQATSPLRLRKDIDNAITSFKKVL